MMTMTITTILHLPLLEALVAETKEEEHTVGIRYQSGGKENIGRGDMRKATQFTDDGMGRL